MRLTGCRLALAALAVVLGTPQGFAQNVPKPKRITMACSVCGAAFMETALKNLAESLRKAGVVVGRDVEIVHRHLSTEEVPSEAQLTRLIADAVGTRPDVFYPMDLYSVIAARREVREIPTVFWVFDPVGLGIVDSLARPGGNMTGFANSGENLDIKRLQLLHEMVPEARRVGVLTQGNYPALAGQAEKLKAPAATMRIEVREYAAASGQTVASDADALFARMAKDRMDAFLLTDGNTWSPRVVELAAKHRLATIYPYASVARRGGIAGYSPIHRSDAVNTTIAGYIAQLLKGRKPSELPVQTPSEYAFVVNAKAAREAGLAIPGELLLKATEINE